MKSNYLIFLFFSSFCFSQNHVIIDSITKKTIPYANIKIIGTERGFYSNDDGVFILEKTHNKDSIQISCLGYQTIFNKINLLKDTVFLTPQIELLNEVSIRQKPPTLKRVGFKKRNYVSFYNNSSLQLALFIQPIKKYENSIIKTIIIPVRISEYSNGKQKKIFSNFEGVFKVSIFSNKNNSPYKPLLSTPIIINCNQDSDKLIKVNIAELVEFNKEGVFICLEKVGEIDDNKNVINNESPRPGFLHTTKESKDFKISKTFYKEKTLGIWNEMNLKSFGYKKNMYLAIQLELAIYED